MISVIFDEPALTVKINAFSLTITEDETGLEMYELKHFRPTLANRELANLATRLNVLTQYAAVIQSENGFPPDFDLNLLLETETITQIKLARKAWRSLTNCKSDTTRRGQLRSRVAFFTENTPQPAYCNRHGSSETHGELTDTAWFRRSLHTR